MSQLFSRPDPYLRTCGRLDCALVERRLSGTPDFLRGARALFITDTHVTARTTRGDLEAFAARIAAIRPDILFWGGDFADQAPHARRLFAAVKGLKPPLGSYAAPGNNDREAWPNLDGLRGVMADASIRLLVNQSESVALNGGALIIAGIDEYFLGAPDSRGLYPEEASEGRFRLLLSHFPILPEHLPDLMLCGHTHGGQFNLLGITPYSIGFERLFSRKRPPAYIAGLYDAGTTRMLVSKGIGASRIPLRVGVRPEIELLKFV